MQNGFGNANMKSEYAKLFFSKNQIKNIWILMILNLMLSQEI